MGNVILCSQSAVLRRSLASMLTRLGHYVLETDGTIALISACLTRRVDMVMIDGEQDYLSAPATIRCLRCTASTARIPIVALGPSVHKLHAAVSAGADHALVTPIETRALLRALGMLSPPPELAASS